MVAAAAAASPSPAPAPHAAAGRPHPTYTKMITQALTELGGASRRGAIAARIRGRGYSGLPARHDDLLSAHLRRLLAEGVLLRLDADGPSSSCTYLLAPKPPAGGEEQKRGPGRPRKEKAAAMSPGSAASSTSRGFKRGCGRSRKDQPVGGSTRRDKEEGAYEVFFRDMMMTEARGDKEDLVSGEKTPRTEEGVAQGDGKDTSAAAAADAGCVPVDGEAAASAPVGGVDSNHLGTADLADDVVSTAGVKRGRGRPRKEKPAAAAAAAAAMSAETGHDDAAASTGGVKRGRGRPAKNKPASTGVKRGRGRPRKEKLASAAAGTGVKRGRGRPRKEKLASAAAATGVKRGRGRPRKDKSAAAAPATEAATGVKRGRGRPMNASSVGTWFAESVAERDLFGDMEEAPGDSVEAGSGSGLGPASML